MRRRANTLMEMMISIAVMGVLVSLLIPAVQKARESANRTTCANNLRQLSLGIQNYQNDFKRLPAGYEQIQIDVPPPRWCGNSWLAMILTYVEQDTVAKSYNYTNPFASVYNQPIGVSPTSYVVPTFLCPSDRVPPMPFEVSSALDDTNVPGFYAPTSYVGNTGTVSFPLDPSDPATYPADGVLNVVSPNFPTSLHLDFVEVSDGQSHTVLLGERFHFDPAFDQMPLGTIDYPIANWSAWGWVGGIQATGHVLGSAQVPLNYRVTASNLANKNARLAGFGSAHSSGCQFAMCDGSVIYVRDTVRPIVLTLLCNRYDGPAPAGSYE